MRVNKILSNKIWDTVCDDPSCDIFQVEIKPEIRKALLKIAHEFILYLDVKVPFEDIVITGSMANFNYTDQSDIDLHVIYDFEKVNEDQDLVDALMKSKRRLWNNDHNIKIHGHDVEVYPEAISEEHHSTGVFSIMKNKWIIKPTRIDPQVNEKQVIKKTKDIMDRIDNLETLENKLKGLQVIKDKIMKMRKLGLETKGEFSEENLSFKLLRNTGYIKKLNDIITDEYDSSLNII